MAKRSRSGQASTKAFITRLRETMGALPTEAEKRETEANLTALIGFLTEMQQKFQSLPSIDDMSEVRRAVEALQGLFERAEGDPVLAVALGLRKLPAVG
jgi:hypothetical protein